MINPQIIVDSRTLSPEHGELSSGQLVTPEQVANLAQGSLFELVVIDPIRKLADGSMTYDANNGLMSFGGKTEGLTVMENKILDRLTLPPGVIRSRDDLLKTIWGDEYTGDPHVVDVHLSNLKGKMPEKVVQYVQTIRSRGWLFLEKM